MSVSVFNKVADQRTRHRHFPVHFVKLLRTLRYKTPRLAASLGLIVPAEFTFTTEKRRLVNI